MTLYIDGNNFSNLHEFYNEIELKLTKNLDWKIGRNLDAFNDVLRGGFGEHEYEQDVVLIWKNSSKSKTALGYKESLKYLENKLNKCHLSNKASVQQEIKALKKSKASFLFDLIIDIIKEHEYIQLRLE